MDVTRYREELFSAARRIFAVDSPSGYTRNVIELIRSMAEELGYAFETTRKGCGVITAEGRDPGSVNLPLDELERVSEQISDMDTPVFVFCLSGGRSARAESTLKRMGYRSVTNIGGISGYLGTTEKGAAK